MNPGYVYILINQSMPGMIKIGKTRRDSRARARELYQTGVPTPFQIAFEVFCDDYDQTEKKIHNELNDFRVNNNREFFKYPLDKAISLLQKLSNPDFENDSYSAIDITASLMEKYSQWIKSDIVSIRIVQTKERVWLEFTTEEERGGNLIDQTIKRTDLAFISGEGDEKKFFSPIDDVSINAKKFIEDFDPYSIINTTDIFHDEGAQEVNEKFNPCRDQ